MSTELHPRPGTRALETIFKAHFENSVTCSRVLHDLFSNLEEPAPYITQIKQLEEAGDQLAREAYSALELYEYSGFTLIIEDLVKRLDDIVDGFNKTAKLIDIFRTKHIEEAAYDILSEQQIMIERLQQEINVYPDNDLESLKACRKVLKEKEESVDIIYHEWRKKERRILELPLIEESNWTEIFAVLEQTTDDIYNTTIILEKIANHRQRGAV